jgi:hypothetical protein
MAKGAGIEHPMVWKAAQYCRRRPERNGKLAAASSRGDKSGWAALDSRRFLDHTLTGKRATHW